MNRRDYISRINLAIDYIQTHLHENPSLQAISDVASFSPYHFHRIWKALMGETLNDYVRRLRLERAAYLLQFQPLRSITDISLDCGFTSNAAFSRAFTQYFGASPSRYRNGLMVADRKICKPLRKDCKEQPCVSPYDQGHAAALSGHRKGHDSMQISVQTLPTYHVAYVRHFGGLEKGVYNPEASAAFDRAAAWLEAHDLFSKDTICLGIMYDFMGLTDDTKVRYDGAFTVPDRITQGSGEVGIQDIPGGKYAVARVEVDNTDQHAFARAIEKLGEASDKVYRDWLPDSGYTPADKPCLEKYLTHKDAPTIVIELCVPIQPE